MATATRTQMDSPPHSTNESDRNNTVSSSTNTRSILLTEETIKSSFSLDPIPRFLHLLAHAKSLIRLYGPYKTTPDSTAFARAPTPRTVKLSKPPSSKLLATSFAAAQDAVDTPQPAGPAANDFNLFKLLWNATTDAIENVLEREALDQETFGWGVFGLASGYIPRKPAADVFGSVDPVFDSHKKRLYAALTTLPCIDAPEHGRQQIAVPGPERIREMQKARREIHVCSSLLMQKIRNDGWGRLRWWHGIAVAERWIGHLGLIHSTMRQEEREAGLGRGLE